MYQHATLNRFDPPFARLLTDLAKPAAQTLYAHPLIPNPKPGGLRDKPSKRRDYYHTCYCLSGLSVAQHSACSTEGEGQAVVIGPAENQVVPVDAILNIVRHKAKAAVEHFSALGPFRK